MAKKNYRSLSKKRIENIIKTDIFKLYMKDTQELFLGIRNEYINIYYKGASICKMEPHQNSSKISYTISSKYSKALSNKYKSNTNNYITLYDDREIIENIKAIKTTIDNNYSDNGKVTDGKKEKTAQQQLILQNNNNENSKWFCLDMEYENKGKGGAEDKFGRFDIIAISKEKPYNIALIELKYADESNTSIGGKSGVAKHINDFDEYINSNIFKEHLLPEVVAMINTYQALGIKTPFRTISTSDFQPMPQPFIITLGMNKNTVQTMRNYIFKDENKDGKKTSSVHSFEEKNNKCFNELKIKPVFYFTENNADAIQDILDKESYYTEIKFN